MKAPAFMLLAALWLASVPVRAADRLDWIPDEQPAGPFVGYLRDVRDGLLGLLDCALDLQLAAFSELALSGSAALMGVSDLVGVADDNRVTQHLLKAQVSKSIARTAYLVHIVGAESVLGSHGLETEWYLAAALDELNPLLPEESRATLVPLEPLAFFSDELFHERVYAAHVPGSLALAAVAADGLVRPAGFALRIVGLGRAGRAVEDFGTGLVRRALR